MLGKTEVITAPANEVFCVTYTFKLEKRVFYKFFGTKYEQNQDRLRFVDARVPINIPVEGGSIYVGQEIHPPELDKRTATIFILRMQMPRWFDLTEEDADKYVAMAESSQTGVFERLYNDALASHVLGGK